MTAIDNVSFPMVFSGVPPRERTARAAKLLDEIGLTERRHHKPSELSGGEQQRVALARAPANSPALPLGRAPRAPRDAMIPAAGRRDDSPRRLQPPAPRRPIPRGPRHHLRPADGGGCFRR